jgi:hypothetical protein
MKELEIALTTYIALEHTQEECIGFIDGFKAAEEKMYSKEEVIRILDKREDYLGTELNIIDYLTNKEWFGQFKTK